MEVSFSYAQQDRKNVALLSSILPKVVVVSAAVLYAATNAGL
jgi:hypothetical protein